VVFLVVVTPEVVGTPVEVNPKVAFLAAFHLEGYLPCSLLLRLSIVRQLW
jgi:hypothetical protein